jgi:hypothetical protein
MPKWVLYIYLTTLHSKHVHLHVFQGGSGSQQGGGLGYDFVDTLLNPMGGFNGSNAAL